MYYGIDEDFVITCIRYIEKVTNEQVLERLGEKRTLPNNILRRKN